MCSEFLEKKKRKKVHVSSTKKHWGFSEDLILDLQLNSEEL